MPWFRKKGTSEVKEVIDEQRVSALRSDPENFEEITTSTDNKLPQIERSTTVGDRNIIDIPIRPDKRSDMSQGEALLRGGATGYTMGAAPLVSDKERYKKAQEEYPKTFIAGDVISGLLPSPVDFIPGGALARRAKTAKRTIDVIEAANALKKANLGKAVAASAGRAALRGGVEGGVRGALSTEGGIIDRTKGALMGTATGTVGGATMGAAIPVGVAGIKRVQSVPAWFSKAFSGIEGDTEANRAMNRMLSTGKEGEAARLLAREGKRQGIDVTEAEKTIKKALGPSPGEIAQEQIKTRQQKIIGYTGKLEQQQKDTIQRNFQNDVSELAKLKDEVLEEAHTGLKGKVALKDFTEMYKSVPKDKLQLQAKLQRTSYKRSQDIVSETGAMAQKIIDDDTYEKAAQREAKDLLRKLNEYGARLNESQGSGSFLLDPQGMADTYVIIDNVKRDVGDVVKAIGRTDRTAEAQFNYLYHNIIPYLEDEQLFGNMAIRQKEINEHWVSDLMVSPAVNATIMRSAKKRALPAANKFEKRPEVEGSSVSGILADPANPKYDADMRNINNWLESSVGLSEVLTKHYNDIPRLRAKTARMQELKQKILSEIDTAKEHASSSRIIGLTDEQKALQSLVRSKGNPSTRSALKKLLETEKQSKVFNPTKVRELQKAEEAYKHQIGSKLEEIGPEYKAVKDIDVLRKAEGGDSSAKDILKTTLRTFIPEPTKAARRMQATESAINRLANKGSDVIAPKFGTRSAWNVASEMWGNRPISDIEEKNKEDFERDPRLEAEIRINSYKKNTNKPKVRVF